MTTEPDASVVGRRTSNLALHSREGYEVREGEIKPDTRGESHVHDRDAPLFVLDGHLMLVRGGDRETFDPGETCGLSAGTLQ
jgi:quercetin dioxygenase-like cupin family protein